jgi:hypothetical protein
MAQSTSTVWQSLDPIIEKGGLLLSFVLLLGLTSGCGDSSKISSAVFTTKTSGEPVVQAAKDALRMIGYQVGEKGDTKATSESPPAILGERVGGMVTAFGPATVHIQIVVAPLGKGSQIQVDIIPPTGAYGSTALPLHDYQYALSQLLPDVSVKSRNVQRELL